MFVTLFDLTSDEGRDALAELAEDLPLTMIERSKGCNIDTGDVAALLSLELISNLAAYNRAPLVDPNWAMLRRLSTHSLAAR
jgi:hypothetical protein